MTRSHGRTARSTWPAWRGSAPRASQAANAVATADTELSEVTSPWLLPPVVPQLEQFSEQVDEASVATEVGALATEQLPALLGAEGPRRYLLLLGSPSEARDVGGHLGNWAELVVDDGKLDVVQVGEPYELFGPNTQPAPQLSPDTELPPSLVEVDPTRFPQNWGSLPTSMRSPDSRRISSPKLLVAPRSTA